MQVNEILIGREDETALLKKMLGSHESEFLAIYGRRRVGKTFLIRQCFESRAGVYFEITGIKDALLRDHLTEFASAISQQLLDGLPVKTPSSWLDAFKLLIQAIEKKRTNKKVVLFFDEVPWLASRRSKFIQALGYLWNSWASKRSDIVLVVCGSAASWITNKIINDKGGLHNRITQRVRLLPFSLYETEIFLQSRHVKLDKKQILDLYMTMGGVPHYLKQIDPKLSAAQNIQRICFTKDGLLIDEFTRLYHSLFENAEHHLKVVTALAKKRVGLNRNELIGITNIQSGGALTKTLQDLEESGFIAKYASFSKKSKEMLYRLIDEYSLFYLTWIVHIPKSMFLSPNNQYWLNKQTSAKWRSWSGYSFESVCLKHCHELKESLGIRGINSIEYSWQFRPKTKSEHGAQIDLLLDRADHCITVCEMKYSEHEFVISKAYAEDLKRKMAIFREKTQTRKSLFLVIVSTHGVKINEYYHQLVSEQIRMEDLFSSSN